MNTLMQSNKYNEATSQTSKLKGVKVPREINVNEKYYYHVLVVKSKADPVKMEYVHEVKVQVINPESFERNKETYKQLGYSNMVVFHNPIVQKQIEAEAKSKADAELQKEADEKAKADAKLEAENKAKAKLEQENKEKADKKLKEDSDAKLKAGTHGTDVNKESTKK